MKPSWYLNRLRRMGVTEMGWRARNKLLAIAWRRRMGQAWPVPPRDAGRGFRGAASLPPLDPDAAVSLLAAAEGVLTGNWPVFDAACDLTGDDPDWHRDPRTGQGARADQYCFDVRYRDAAHVPNVKHLWEVSRLHHVTLLAAAYAVSGEDRYAERAATHWASWFRRNPPLLGPHWVSGIEMGLRLIALVWTRRLLDAWPGAANAFEDDPECRRQIHAHQAWIATFHSRHSSSNNHVIAEMAGLLAAAHAFPLFPESESWAALASSVLTREAEAQTFPDGVNRELASEYHVFVLELLLLAGAEADHAARPLPEAYWRVVGRMADALAGMVDARGHTGRQGDSDSGHALVLDAPQGHGLAGQGTGGQEAGHTAEASVLAVCEQAFGAAPWWPPRQPGGIGAALLGRLIQPRHGLLRDQPAERPDHYPDAGITLLRTRLAAGKRQGKRQGNRTGAEEIWCRFDHGPHGFLSTTAHAHADALSVEVRAGGQEILIDPGTYCYHDERAWRDHFRSTMAHNTLEIGGRDQAAQAGPFLWLSRPDTGLTAHADTGAVVLAEAWHDGYTTRAARVLHHRRVILNRETRELTLLDRMTAPAETPVRLAFHFHPDVAVSLSGHTLALSWNTPDGQREARMTLPASLSWQSHTGETAPLLGWYSPAFGQRRPATSLIGSGILAPDRILRSQIVFPGLPDARQGLFEDSISGGIPA